MESYTISDNKLKFNDRPELVWIRVKDAAKLLWNENPKLHSIGDLITSIEKYGFISPSKFDDKLTNISGTLGAVVAGNGRIEALSEMEKLKKALPRGIAITKDGDWAMPVIVGVNCKNAFQAKSLAIDDNNLTLAGGDLTALDMSRIYNSKTYLKILNELSDADEAPVSIDKDTISRLSAVLGEQENPKDAEPQIDKAEELQKKWGVRTGDLFVIGNHKLLCGDSTKREDVEKVMGGERADCVMTDPPYGMNLDTDYSNMPETRIASKTYERVEGDDKDFDIKPFIEMFDYCKEQFWWGGDYYYPTLPPHGSWIVWDKRNENSDGLVGNHFEICWSRKIHRRHIIRVHWSGVNARNAKMERSHPTEKSIKVIGEIIDNYTEINSVIVDLFAGVGTTLIASQNLSRKCRAIEISEKYCAVILQRMTDAFPGILIEKIEQSYSK